MIALEMRGNMTKTERLRLRKELDRIEKTLLKGDAVSSALWNIMTAQRGPDDERQKGYTIRVRRKAFPKLARRKDVRISGSVFHYYNFPGVEAPRPLTDGETIGNAHFRAHIRKAYRALGLKN